MIMGMGVMKGSELYAEVTKGRKGGKWMGRGRLGVVMKGGMGKLVNVGGNDERKVEKEGWREGMDKVAVVMKGRWIWGERNKGKGRWNERERKSDSDDEGKKL